MRVVMINDCAFVGQTLLKTFPFWLKAVHIRRTRNIWSKTFGIALKTIGVNGDIYHVHYLLQDCFLASMLGKHPLIGHAHGSDLRKAINHRIWAGIVKHNLKSCSKILVSTPDLLEKAKEFNNETEYLPNPFDRTLFYTRPKESQGRRIRVLLAGKSDWNLKRTDIAIRALSNIKEYTKASIVGYGKDFIKTINLAKALNLKLNILPKVSHDLIRNYYWSSDVVVDQFPDSGTIGNVGIEAIACGRPVITYIKSNLPEYHAFPLLDIRTEEDIERAILSPKKEVLWKKQYEYIRTRHDPEIVATRLIEIYKEVINQRQ